MNELDQLKQMIYRIPSRGQAVRTLHLQRPFWIAVIAQAAASDQMDLIAIDDNAQPWFDGEPVKLHENGNTNIVHTSLGPVEAVPRDKLN